jgi:hypothetical protein
VEDNRWEPDPAHLFPVSHLFDMLGFRRISGKIQIATNNQSYGLFVDRGSFLAATSSQRTLRLGHLLLQRGAVEPTFLHDVLRGRRSVPHNQAIGGALMSEGAVTRAALLATVEEQIVEVLSRVICADDATIQVIADEPVPDGIEVTEFDTDELFEEAHRRHFRRAAIRAMQRLLPAHDAPLHLVSHLALISSLLTDPELLVALQVDKGNMTLERLGTVLPLEPLVLKRTVISLFEREFISVAR